MRYTATSVVKLGPGAILGLTKDQARDRAHVLKPAPRKGFFETTGHVQFKVGEVFDYHGTLPKSMAETVEPEEDAKARAAEEAKAAAAAREPLLARIAELEQQFAASQAALAEAVEPKT